MNLQLMELYLLDLAFELLHPDLNLDLKLALRLDLYLDLHLDDMR
jgi:hypothetical protein